MSMVNLYNSEKICDEILKFKDIIDDLYHLDDFILSLNFENTYKKDDVIIRLDLSNDIKNRHNNNGLIRLYHKIFYMSEYDDMNKNDIVLLFFNMQSQLKDMDLSYELKDHTLKDDDD